MQSLALTFPGQGSQVVGMGQDLAAEYSSARAVFDEGSFILGFDLAQLCAEGPEERLRETANAQPAIFATSVAALRSIEEELGGQLEATVVAGHSVGEYSALVAAGALTFSAGLKLVAERGRLMALAAAERPGGMAAVLGLDREAIEIACRQSAIEGSVVVANDNGPGQIVISGDIAAVNRASRQCLEAGAKRVIPLPVSGGFHSPLMATAAAELARHIEQTPLACARRPIITNTDVQSVTRPTDIRAELCAQVCGAVQWMATIARIVGEAHPVLVEIGPGKALSGLARRIAPTAQVRSVGTVESVRAFVGELTASSARRDDGVA